MRRVAFSLLVVSSVLLLSLLLADHATRANPAEGVTLASNGLSYLPFVARNWLPSAQPTPTIPPEQPSISGKVLEAATGGPLGGATVEVYDSEEHLLPMATTTTDISGDYHFGPIPQGEYYVLAYADGYAREIYRQAAVVQDALIVRYTGELVMGIDFALAEGGSISGRVTQADGVTPLAGIHVRATQAKYAWVANLWFKALSDPSGHYRLDHLPLGQFVVVAEGDGYVNEFHDGVNYLGLSTPVSVEPPHETIGIDMAMDPEARLSGRVIDDDTGAPIEGAIVHLLPSGPGTAPTWGMGGETGERGQFMVNRLPPADYLVSSRAEEYGDEIFDHQPGWSTADLVPVPPGGDVSGVTLRMRRGGLLRGHLFDEFGVPLPGFWMTVRLPDGDLAGAMPEGSRTDGSFWFRMPPGTYVVMADAVPGYVREYYDGVYRPEDAIRFDVTVGSEVGGIDFTIQLAGSISGAVYRSDGVTPVPGAQVYAFPLDTDFGDGAITGPGGQYRIEGLPSGHYRIDVNVPGYEMLVYYPGTFEEGDAMAVQVTAPAETGGIDIIVPDL
jgi:hypothetical protein